MRTIFIIVYIFSFYIPFAQIPSPAPPQSKPIALIGEIHTGRGEVISDGLVAFHQGVITFIGEKTAFELEGYDVRDMSGKHIYPGFILADTYLGLSEIDAIKATRDYNEMGSFNPNVRTLIAYNADSKIIPTTRSNGILLAQITPRSGVLSGASSIVELDAWNWEEAAYKIDEGQHFHWPYGCYPPDGG